MMDGKISRKDRQENGVILKTMSSIENEVSIKGDNQIELEMSTDKDDHTPVSKDPPQSSTDFTHNLKKDEVNQTNKSKEEEANADQTSESHCLFTRMQNIKDFVSKHRAIITRVLSILALMLYLCYTGYALYLQWGTESATRLLLLLFFVLIRVAGGPRYLYSRFRHLVPSFSDSTPERTRRIMKIVRWCLYVVAVAGAVVFFALEVGPKRPRSLVGLVGIAVLLLAALLLSSHPRRVNWHTVFWGLSLQFYLAVFLLQTEVGREIFEWLGDRLSQLLHFSETGSKFLFGDPQYLYHRFIFQTLPTVLFMNVLIAVCYHFGVIQAIVAVLGGLLAKCLDTTAVESVNAAANIFLGLAEAPLFIKPFLPTVTESELFAIMTGGFSSIAGAVMAVIISYGIPIKHVLAASVMSAPAALAIAKIMCPETTPKQKISKRDPFNMDIGQPPMLIAAMADAAMMGVTIVVNVVANILIFVSIIDLLDSTFAWFTLQAGVLDFSLMRLMGYLFYPLMFVIGVDSEDLLTMGSLVGLKTLTNSAVSYAKLGSIIDNSQNWTLYKHQTNGSWHYQGDDVFLDAWNQTLVGGVLSDRSTVVSIYVMCGFCNISSVGVTIGVYKVLTPQRSQEITNMVMKACLAGNIACFLTGCVAGLAYSS